MSISDKSPHLAGVIRRKLPTEASPLLEQAFELSIQAGGLGELDFTRDPEVSYNPHPARVALILIQDAGVRDEEIIAGGILACVWPKFETVTGASKLPENVRNLAQAAAEAKAAEVSVKVSPGTELSATEAGPLLIRLALQLDRARHLHLAANPDWKPFIEETKLWAKVAECLSPPLHLLIHAWTERIERQLRMRGIKLDD